MKSEINEIEVNGVAYIRKDSVSQNAPAYNTDGLPYVIIRSRDSGCHAGYLKSEDGNTVILVNSRRLWYWSGAATLSELANNGVKNPGNCKFPEPVDEITVYGVCEKIPAKLTAQKSIEKVDQWKA